MDGAEESQTYWTDIILEGDSMDASCSPSTKASNRLDFEGSAIDTLPPVRDTGTVHAALLSLREQIELQSKLTEHPHSMLKGPSDCDDPIAAHYQKVMNLSPDYPHLPAMLSAQGHTFNKRYQRTGDPSDVSRAIEAYRKVISLTPKGHDFLPARLANLGAAFFCRFERAGDLSDVAEAIVAHQDAIELTPEGQPDLSSYVNNLGIAFMSRFEQTGELSDLGQGIAAQRKALVLVTPDDTEAHTLLHNMGNSLLHRFQRMGDISDLTEAVVTFCNAVEHTPDGHTDLPARLSNCGTALMLRFERMGDLCDISEAIALQQRAVELTPDGHINLPTWLSSLAGSFIARFERTGDVSDISSGIAAQQRATGLTPADHPMLADQLSNLACTFSCRFERTGELSDIDESIQTLQTAISLAPDGHAHLCDYLNNLAVSFTSRFERTGDPSDLAEAVAALEKAVNLTPEDHPDLHKRLNNLGATLQSRFELTGNLADIDRAIGSCQRAIELAPYQHPNLSREFGNLGNSFKVRFERTGALSDLDDAIEAHRTAIELISDGHAELPGQLCNLGNAYLVQFQRTGDLSAAAEAIAAHQKALDLTPDGHVGLPSRLTNLGCSYIRRFHHKGDVSDLTEAIALYQRAVACTPKDHAHIPVLLNNFATSLTFRFQLTDNLRDIAQAIEARRRAVDLTPEGHAHHPILLNSLGKSLTDQFSRTGDLSVIDEAVMVLERSVAATPEGHPSLPAMLKKLSDSFMLRFTRTHDPSDMSKAITVQQKAVDLTPDGDADLPGQHISLAAQLEQHAPFARNGGAMDASIGHYKFAANCTSGPPSHRLKAAIAWASLSYQYHPDSPETLNAFDTAIHSLSLIAGLEDTVEGRYMRLPDVSDFPRQAAAAACSLGRPDKALEWLEQSRCLVWTQLNNLRTPLDALRVSDEALAQRLSQVSRQLEAAGSSRRAAEIEMPLSDKISATNEAHAHLKLAKEWGELIDTVRCTVPGFENFLQPTPSSTLLRHLPDSGPVVIVNVHQTRCDAIVLRAGQDVPTSLPLPEFSSKKAIEYRERLSLVLRQRGLRLREAGDSSREVIGEELGRGIRQMKGRNENSVVFSILENLWKEIVKPVLAGLGFSILDATSLTPPPRIWWCPTGPLSFLPLHAAGVYGKRNSESIFDYAVSSYTPTVTSIIDRVKNDRPIDAMVSGLLLTSQPDVPGASSIPGVTKEVTTLHTLATEQGVRSLKLEGGAATVPEFLEHMDGYSSVHLACHASQDASEPLRSRFLFHNGSLDLATINKKNLKNADLAFLSACQTSTGEEKLTEEAVHLAAGMLGAGYRRVVATMWAIKDEHAPDVAGDFYDYLCSMEPSRGG